MRLKTTSSMRSSMGAALCSACFAASSTVYAQAPTSVDGGVSPNPDGGAAMDVAAPSSPTPPAVRSTDHGHPEYPAPGDGQPARVLLELTFDAVGTLTDAVVVEVDRIGDMTRVFGDAALAYVRTLAFDPATDGERPVPARIRFQVLFEPPEHQHPHEHRHTHRTTPSPEVVSGSDPDFRATATVPLGAGDADVTAASDIEIEVGVLRSVPRRSAAELLTLAPGVTLGNHSGEGHANNIFLRGFDGGEGQDVEVLLDGITINEPSNAHGHGYADTGFIIPELVRAVRVVEGPFDPRQGDFAVAGTFEYQLAVEERGVRAQAEYGSFNEQRGLVLWAPEDAEDETFVGIDLRQGDGFGPNRAHQRASVMAQYALTDGPLHGSVFATSSALQFDSAGVIREDDFDARRLRCPASEESQFFCLYDANQGGSASRHVIGGRLEWRRRAASLKQHGFVSLRQHRVRENFTGFLLDARGDGLDELTETVTVGLRGSYRTELPWGEDQHMELGYDARHDTGNARMWRLRTEGGAPYRAVFDSDLSITHIGAYALAEVEPWDWLGVRGGIRADAFSYSLVDNDRPAMDRIGERLPFQATDALGLAVEPRGTVEIEVLPDTHVLISAGIGARSSDAQALSEGETAPFAEVHALEGGVVYERDDDEAARVSVRGIAFYTRVSRDLVFDQERGRNVDVGASARFGALASGRIQLDEWLDVLASFTWSEAHRTEGGLFHLGEGPRLPFVPRFVGRLDGAVLHTVTVEDEDVRLLGGLGIGFVGPKPLPLDTESEPTLNVDVGARARWRFVELGVMAQNIFDIDNRDVELSYPSNFDATGGPSSLRAARHFAAGRPQSFFVTLTFFGDTSFLGEDE